MVVLTRIPCGPVSPGQPHTPLGPGVPVLPFSPLLPEPGGPGGPHIPLDPTQSSTDDVIKVQKQSSLMRCFRSHSQTNPVRSLHSQI